MICKNCESNKCTKKGAIKENLCNKCFSRKGLCGHDSCPKKLSIDGYCYIHISLYRDVKQVNLGRPVTEEDITRREKAGEKIRQNDAKKELIKEEINQRKSETPYDAFTHATEKINIILMEERLENLRISEEYRLDCEIEELLNEHKKMYERENPRINKFKMNFDDLDNHTRRRRQKQKEKQERAEERKYAKPQRKNRFQYDGSSYQDDEYHEEEIQSPEESIDRLFIEAFILLGIDKTNDLSIIKHAYYRKAKELHPDRDTSEGATARFQELGFAYDFLLKWIRYLDI